MDRGPNLLKLHMCWANARSRVSIGDGRDKLIINDPLVTTWFITDGEAVTIYYCWFDHCISFIFMHIHIDLAQAVHSDQTFEKSFQRPTFSHHISFWNAMVCLYSVLLALVVYFTQGKCDGYCDNDRIGLLQDRKTSAAKNQIAALQPTVPPRFQWSKPVYPPIQCGSSHGNEKKAFLFQEHHVLAVQKWEPSDNKSIEVRKTLRPTFEWAIVGLCISVWASVMV